MKYKHIYSKNRIVEDPLLLYGYFYKEGMYKIKNIKDLLYIYNETTNYEPCYAEVKEYELYKDILVYGEKLYIIFKNNLQNIYKDRTWTLIGGSIVNNQAILKKRNIIKDILLDFVSNYNIPIYPIEANSFATPNCIEFGTLVNQILYIYILNIIYTKLSFGLNNYKEAYDVFEITSSYTDDEILKELTNIFNITTGANFKLGIYRTEIITRQEKNNVEYIPIRYTTNLFTFAWELLQNFFCSSILVEEFEEDYQKDYYLYRRCPKCLKTLHEIMSFPIEYDKFPNHKIIICNDCNNKIKLNNKKNTDHFYNDGISKLRSNLKDLLKKISLLSQNDIDFINEIKKDRKKHRNSKSDMQKLIIRVENYRKSQNK